MLEEWGKKGWRAIIILTMRPTVAASLSGTSFAKGIVRTGLRYGSILDSRMIGLAMIN